MLIRIEWYVVRRDGCAVCLYDVEKNKKYIDGTLIGAIMYLPSF